MHWKYKVYGTLGCGAASLVTLVGGATIISAYLAVGSYNYLKSQDIEAIKGDMALTVTKTESRLQNDNNKLKGIEQMLKESKIENNSEVIVKGIEARSKGLETYLGTFLNRVFLP